MIYSYGARAHDELGDSEHGGPRDVLPVDEGISRNVLSGITLARRKVVYSYALRHPGLRAQAAGARARGDRQFSHGQADEDHHQRGHFPEHGKLAPVDKLCALRIKYRCRFILDESLSFGVLGETAAERPEHLACP